MVDPSFLPPLLRFSELLLSLSSLQLFVKQLELSELESLLRVDDVRPLGFSGEEPSPGVEATLADGVGAGLLTELTGTVEPGRFDALPDGDGVGVELD